MAAAVVVRVLRAGVAAVLAAIVPAAVIAADYRATTETPSILYDAPSAKAKPLFVYGRDVPVEVLVTVEGWTKVRDAAGSIGWLASKGLADKHVLMVRVPVADVRANPDETSPMVFRAEQHVLLEMAETASSAATTASPGWVKVRHRDGQTGYVRIAQVYGL